ncbi:MAG TPA: peptidase [Clostridiaceae bacterium]|nr:peptidase [Clostridiaceae bacterium]
MQDKLLRGASIVVRDWVRLKPWQSLLIVTSNNYMREAIAIKNCALKRTVRVDMLIVDDVGKDVGICFDKNENAFDGYSAIIAATEYSLVTTLAAKRVIGQGKKFLSLPLSTSDGVSMLEYDFMTMDTKKSKLMANIIVDYLVECSTLRVETKAGTHLTMSKKGRNPGFYNGVCKDGKGFSSASIELYVPIIEEATEGIMIVDCSLGYLGKCHEPVKLVLQRGRIIEIEDNPCGRKLKEYIESYGDEGLFYASEFGIGLNTISKCRGRCYVEDESAYGTFHIGFGRNLALGGQLEARGHYDLISMAPNIYADNRQIMSDGIIIIPEPVFYG